MQHGPKAISLQNKSKSVQGSHKDITSTYFCRSSIVSKKCMPLSTNRYIVPADKNDTIPPASNGASPRATSSRSLPPSVSSCVRVGLLCPFYCLILPPRNQTLFVDSCWLLGLDGNAWRLPHDLPPFANELNTLRDDGILKDEPALVVLASAQVQVQVQVHGRGKSVSIHLQGKQEHNRKGRIVARAIDQT